MINISPNNLQAMVAAVNFTLRHFVPERQIILQNLLAGGVECVSFATGSRWHTDTNDGLTMLQGCIRPHFIQRGDILALRSQIWKQSDAVIDEFNRVCRHRCQLVDVQLLVDLGDGSTKLFPQTEPAQAADC